LGLRRETFNKPSKGREQVWRGEVGERKQILPQKEIPPLLQGLTESLDGIRNLVLTQQGIALQEEVESLRPPVPRLLAGTFRFLRPVIKVQVARLPDVVGRGGSLQLGSLLQDF